MGSKYSLDQIHEHKNPYERRNGKTVDAVMELIGKIMVTENETIPFVIRYMDRSRHILHEFFDICESHFSLSPKRSTRYTIEIEGYSSKGEFIPLDKWETYQMTYHSSVVPVFDLD